MGEKEILENTTRSTGRDALKKNVQAAIALSGAIRSTLGPKGLDKLLIDDDGRTLVTNDGVTVLETAKVEHPVAKMVIGASSLQDKIAKDGTTSTVILASEMLRNAWELVVQGIHPAVISRGFRMAEQKVVETIDGLSLEGNQLTSILTFSSFALNIVLVIFFSSFYALLVLKPKDLSENLTKMAYGVPGLKQGKETTQYLEQVISRLAFMGGVFLAFLAFFPFLLGNVFQFKLFNLFA